MLLHICATCVVFLFSYTFRLFTWQVKHLVKAVNIWHSLNKTVQHWYLQFYLQCFKQFNIMVNNEFEIKLLLLLRQCCGHICIAQRTGKYKTNNAIAYCNTAEWRANQHEKCISPGSQIFSITWMEDWSFLFLFGVHKVSIHVTTTYWTLRACNCRVVPLLCQTSQEHVAEGG